MRSSRALVILLSLVAGCADASREALSAAHRQALADSALTLFDSLAAIHRDQPDTALLRRLHPSADTVLFIEGATTEMFTGDSLFRRVVASHLPVTRMSQRFTDRRALVLGAAHAVVSAAESVDWVDASGPHHYSGLLTLALSRTATGWAIRAYRGT